MVRLNSDMGGWSDWKPLYHPDGNHLVPSEVPHYGPGVYVLALANHRGKKRFVEVYVGMTTDLNRRIYEHSYGDSVTEKALGRAWNNGYEIHYCVYSQPNERAAKKMERDLLTEWWKYPLNILGNPLRKELS